MYEGRLKAWEEKLLNCVCARVQCAVCMYVCVSVCAHAQTYAQSFKQSRDQRAAASITEEMCVEGEDRELRGATQMVVEGKGQEKVAVI